MATKDGRAQIWYADGSGNVTGYTESVDEIAGTIIDAYNEHFGTDIAIWTPETETLQVGDTVPNWAAYEKIERANIAFRLSGTVADKIPYNIGSILEKTLYLKTDGNTPYAADIDGNIIGNGGAPASVEYYYITQLANYGIQIDHVINDVISLPVGSTISDWNTYSIYGE